MAVNVADLMVNLRAQVAPFQAGMKAAQGTLSSLSSSITSAKRAVVGMITAFAGFRAAKMAVREVVEVYDNWQEAAAKTNLALSGQDLGGLMLAKETLDKARQSMHDIAVAAATELAPYVTVLLNGFNSWIERMGGFREVFKNVGDIAVKVIGFIANSVQGIQFFWKGAELGAAYLLQGALAAADGIARGFQWVGTRISQVWDWIKASGSLAWDVLKVGALSLVAAATVAWADMQHAFSRTIASMGQAAMDSRLKGLTDIGREAMDASRKLMISAAAMRRSAGAGIAAATAELNASAAGVKAAQAALAAEVKTDTGALGELATASGETVKVRQAELEDLRQRELVSDRIEWEVGAEIAAVQKVSAARGEEAQKSVESWKQAYDKTTAVRRAHYSQSWIDQQQRYADELAAANAQYEAKKISWAQLQQTLTEIEERETERREALQARAVESATAGIIALAQVMGEHSKKMFKVWKALAIAEAIGNAAVAITRCYSDLGPIYGTVAAVGVAAACAAQIARIASTQFGGGGSSSAAAAASGGASGGGDGDRGREPARQTLIFQVRGGDMVSASALQEAFRDAKRRNIVFADVQFETGR